MNSHIRPGITPETLRLAGIEPVTPDQAKKLSGLAEPGLWLPYKDWNGRVIIENGIAYGRLRLNSPTSEKKYHQRSGSTVHAYLPPGLSKVAVGCDLYLIEGEFKALSLMEAGFPSVGLSGFFGFATKGGERLIPELSLAIERLTPKRILFCGDSDTALNNQFSLAAMRLARLAVPVPVLLPRIPYDFPGKGADDCRQHLGASFGEFWLNQTAEAVIVDTKSTIENLAVRLLLLEVDSISRLKDGPRERAQELLVKFAAALEHAPLEQDRVTAFAVEKLNVKRASFKKAVTIRCRRVQSLTQTQDGEENGTVHVDMGGPNAKWTREVFERISPDVFLYAENICRLSDGQLVPQSAAEMCSFVDNPEKIIPYRIDSHGQPRPVRFTEADGRILLGACQDSLDLLRVVKAKSNLPVLAWNGREPILVNGYCPKTSILAAGDAIEMPSPDEAVKRLGQLLQDYDFSSYGDMGRVLAALFTPALTQGGFLGEGRAPLFFVEKNEPNAGGSLLIKIISRIYGQVPKPLTQIEDPKRLYEDVSAKLLAGDTIVYFDNCRGTGLQRLPWFESLLTEPTFACRMPYKHGEANVTRRVFAISTNGAVLSNDLSTRIVKISITKRPDGYAWYAWPEGGIEEHVEAKRGFYLGTIYSLVYHWAMAGRPSGQKLTGFRFQQWERGCSWILETFFPGVPLLDLDHKEAQRQLADADYGLLRHLFQLSLKEENAGLLTATKLAELAVAHGLLPPGQKENIFRVGKVLKRLFTRDGEHEFDAGRIRVTRTTKTSASNKQVCYYAITKQKEQWSPH